MMSSSARRPGWGPLHPGTQLVGQRVLSWLTLVLLSCSVKLSRPWICLRKCFCRGVEHGQERDGSRPDTADRTRYLTISVGPLPRPCSIAVICSRRSRKTVSPRPCGPLAERPSRPRGLFPRTRTEDQPGPRSRLAGHSDCARSAPTAPASATTTPPRRRRAAVCSRGHADKRQRYSCRNSLLRTAWRGVRSI